MIDEAKIKTEFCGNLARYLEYKVFYSHGMVELLGNYTDRNRGKAIVAAANQGVLAYVARFDEKVTIRHLGCEDIEFAISDLEVKEEEKFTQVGLTKEILNVLKARGYEIGGFIAVIDDDIEKGSGTCFLAAYEILITKIISHFYNEDAISYYEMGLAAHKAENNYFNPNSSALTQLACSHGGINLIDFDDPERPTVTPLKLESSLKIVLVNPGNNKIDGLTPALEIYDDLQKVAENMFGVKSLRDVDRKDVNVVLSRYVPGISEFAKMRTQHYFGELDRVERVVNAIERKDDLEILTCFKLSGISCKSYLGAGMVGQNYLGSPAEAMDLANSCLGDGACKIHRTGFNGSIVCLVYPKDYSNFRLKMSERYGDNAITLITVPNWGAVEIK